MENILLFNSFCIIGLIDWVKSTQVKIGEILYINLIDDSKSPIIETLIMCEHAYYYTTIITENK